MSGPQVSTAAAFIDVRCGAARGGNAEPCKHLLARYRPGLVGEIELWCGRCRAPRPTRFFGAGQQQEVST